MNKKTPDKESDAHLKIYLNYIRKSACPHNWRNEEMEELYLPPLISDEIAKVYLKQMIEIVKEELKEEMKAENLPLDQKALMKKFGFDHGYIKKLERRGLAFRKQGKKKMYDVRDVYEILEKEKEYLK